MKFIRPPKDKPVRLKLARDRTRMLKQGYPWIYQDWLEDRPAAPAGSRALVRDRDGTLLVCGMYDVKSPLAVRVCAVEREQLDDELILSRLETASALRRSLVTETTTGFRLINGEGDGLPGLVCDLYADHAVLKLDGEGPAGFWNLDGIVEWLESTHKLKAVLCRLRDDENSRGKAIHGELKNPSIRFRENGAHFQADIVQGQKTGFFFDQRDNRKRIGAFAKDRTVLNLFGYTGGFSIYAGIGGARHVTTVDIAKPAIADAKRNWELNGLASNLHDAEAVDAFEFVAAAKTEKRRWDLIVVDPPSFAPAERHVAKALESYESIFASALQVLDTGGVAALSSCSSHISPAMFLEVCEKSVSRAKRRATVLGIYGQPEDHPFPLPCKELQYLKFLLLQMR